MSDFKTLGQQVIDQSQKVMGQDVIYTPDAGDTVTIKGIFDNKYIEIDNIVTLRPTLRISLGDLVDPPAPGDTVEINGEDYNVRESHEDGFGGSLLILMR